MTGLLEFASPLLTGAVGAIVATALARLSRRQRPDRQGWRRIRPSVSHWMTLIGSAGFASLMLYVILFVGSGRADAATQMLWATGMAIAFTLGTLVTLWQIWRVYRAKVFWRGSMIAFSDEDGNERLKLLTEVRAMDSSGTGTIKVTFADGSVMHLDELAQGAAELCMQIAAVSETSETRPS